MSTIKKAILTGGGRATRLRPITTTINKHLIPLANQPMIFYAIQKVVDAGVTEIFINTNPGDKELELAIRKAESRWPGVTIKFFEQTGGPQGIAHVVKCAEKFIGDDPFIFYLSDNIILGSIKDIFSKFDKDQLDCVLAFAKVPDPERFGVPVFNQNGDLVEVVEKPAAPKGNFAVTGIYLYGKKVFFEAFKHIKKSARGEYEISDVNSYLLKHNKKVGTVEITGWWKDTGKPDDLIHANKLLMEELPWEAFKIETTVTLPTKQSLSGKIDIGVNTKVLGDVKLIGPVIIGSDCLLENCTIGPNVTIGTGTTIKNATIKDSIIFAGCTIEATVSMSNSILGEKAAIKKNGASGFHRFILGDHTFIEL